MSWYNLPMTQSDHVEIENTFEVAGDTPVPDPEGFAPLVADPIRVHSLSAVYYDTEDLSLVRHKVTLRRRTGGDDAGWHLKLPAATGRQELHAPLGEADDVPARLVDAVAGLVRRRPLRPVARIDNERHVTLLRDAEGVAAVEFCDDHVDTESFVTTAGGGAWREWEAELVDASRADGEELLAGVTRACVAAGASPSSSASKLARALGELPEQPDHSGSPVAAPIAADLRQMLAHDPGARQGTMVGIHQMRVAVRGLRSTLATYAAELAEPAEEAGLDLPKVLGDLKELAAVLGKARDIQVVDERLAELYGEYPESLVPKSVRDRIVAELAFEETRAQKRVAAALVSTPYLDLLDRLHEVLELADRVHPGASDGDSGRGSEKKGSGKKSSKSGKGGADEVVLRGVDRQFAKFTKVRSRTEKDLESLDLSLAQREELTHVVRKRAKALRRNVNSLPTGGELRVAPLRTACNRLHTVLGDIQDSVTTREWLTRIVRRAEAAGESTFGFGVLYEHERGFSERALAGFESDAATVTAAYRELQESRRASRKRSGGKKSKKG